MSTALATKKLGGMLSIQNGYAFDSKLFSLNDGMPLIRIRDLQSGTETVTKYTGPYSNRYVVKAGDLLIGMDGEFKCYEWHGAPALLNQRVCRLENFKDELDPRYLFYGLNRYLKEIEDSTGFTTVKHISSRQILDIEFPLPSLVEQRRIVSALDKAFTATKLAKEKAEINLRAGQRLFEAYLRDIFTQPLITPGSHVDSVPQVNEAESAKLDRAFLAGVPVGTTRTGGRRASLGRIEGDLSLSVGMPHKSARKGWKWHPLSSLARLESGHTPSRNHPEYWGGLIPWVGIKDAREHHGRRIHETNQYTNPEGIAHSSARILPENTVCLSRTASVGYVLILGAPMATSQDFVNWVCSERLRPDFLKYILLAEGREGLLRYASGSVHQTIYFPEAKAFWVCVPGPEEQDRIVKACDAIQRGSKELEQTYHLKLTALDELKQSILAKAFLGDL